MRKLRLLVMTFIVLVFLLGACSSSSTPADINEILVSGPTVVDIKDRSVTVQAVTSVEVVCAIAFGPTTDYGRIATDDDMAGGGHSNHQPVLRGLQPDTLYHYRLGGIGPNGTVYRSADMTFKTLPQDAASTQQQAGDNLAFLSKGARVVSVSSNYGDGNNDSTWGANHAIDGDPDTQWSTNGDGDNAWIEIELPTETRISAVGFWTRTMGTSAQIFSFRVINERDEVAGPFILDDADTIHIFTTNLTAKRLRFEAINTSGGNTGAVEMEVYGKAIP